MNRRALLRATAVLPLAAPALAQHSNDVVRLGVLNDMSGVFQDTNGPGSVMAARLAAEDYAAQGGRARIEIVSADHQNRPDVGSAIARRWMDQEGVDAILDLPNSAVGLAVNTVLRGSRVANLASTTATSDLTGPQCSPNTVTWVSDTYALGRTAARSMMGQGGDTWFFLTVDYALGHTLQRDTQAYVEQNGGRVIGAARHPLGTADFSSFLLQAQASRAKVLALAGPTPDAGNAIKQAGEFGLTRNMRVVALLFHVNDIHAIGLRAAQGLSVVEPFYWDHDDATRAFARRFAERMGGGRMPSSNQAGVYSTTLAYLKALDRARTDDARAVIPEMKRVPVDDPLFGPTVIREDGRAVHRMLLLDVKRPEESRGAWDYYRIAQVIPGEQAFRPLNEGGCPLIR
ncbi:MAG: ABC transporter substrate-binding protein [Acetobacteraceae bacterium]|nr:ABC transporter substrate-binding protein [Acetobacteraceae bacterium]